MESIFARYSKRHCRRLIAEEAESNLREEICTEACPPPVDVPPQSNEIVFEESDKILVIENETFYMEEDRVFLEDIVSSEDEEDGGEYDDDDDVVEHPTYPMVRDDDKLQILKMKLRRFVLCHVISVSQVSELLSMLREFGINLPKTRTGLLQTKRTPLITRDVPPGKYMYIGIQKNVSMVNCDFLSGENLVFDFNIDGLPLYKSSRKSIWPIQGSFVDYGAIPLFVVGAWVGKGHPLDSDVFFDDFYKELNILKEKCIQNGQKTFNFIARAFICDAPAKSFCKSVLNHNAKHGCHECDQVGFRLLNTTVFSLTSGKLRTDESFTIRADPQHHHRQEKSALETAGIKMVSQFPLDLGGLRCGEKSRNFHFIKKV